MDLPVADYDTLDGLHFARGRPEIEHYLPGNRGTRCPAVVQHIQIVFIGRQMVFIDVRTEHR